MFDVIGRFARRHPVWAWLLPLLALPVAAVLTCVVLAVGRACDWIGIVPTKFVADLMPWLGPVQVGTGGVACVVGMAVFPTGRAKWCQACICLMSVPLVWGGLFVCTAFILLACLPW